MLKHTHVYPNSKRLITFIETCASRDPSTHSVDLLKVTSRIYSDKELLPYMEWINGLHLMGDEYNIPNASYVWGMTYGPQDYTKPHDHPGVDYTGIHYLVADSGCGVLITKDEVIEPKANDLILMRGDEYHGVLPADNDKAKRICIVFNLVKK